MDVNDYQALLDSLTNANGQTAPKSTAPAYRSPQQQQYDAAQALATSPSVQWSPAGQLLQPLLLNDARQKETALYDQQNALRAAQQKALAGIQFAVQKGDTAGAQGAAGQFLSAGGDPSVLGKNFGDLLKAGTAAATTLNAQGQPVFTTQAVAQSNNMSDAGANTTRAGVFGDLANRQALLPIEQQKANAASTDAAAKMGMIGVENNKLALEGKKFDYTAQENNPTAKAAAADLKKNLDIFSQDAQTAQNNMSLIGQIKQAIGTTQTSPALGSHLDAAILENKLGGYGQAIPLLNGILPTANLTPNEQQLQAAQKAGSILASQGLKGLYGGKITNTEVNLGQVNSFSVANSPQANQNYLDRQLAVNQAAVAKNNALQTAVSLGVPAYQVNKFINDWDMHHADDFANPNAQYPDPKQEIADYAANGGKFTAAKNKSTTNNAVALSPTPARVLNYDPTTGGFK